MKILEISQGAAASYAGILLSELQSDVDWIDLRDDTTAADPFLHRDKNLLKSLEDPGNYDAIVEDVGSSGLKKLGYSYRALKEQHADLVIVSLSAFGHSGPYKDWQATDLTVQAAGGVMHVAGYDGEAPMKLPGDAAAMIAGLHGATAVTAAVYGVKTGVETSTHIDISAQDTFMQHWTRHVSMYAYTGALMKRANREVKGIHARHTVMARDGWIYMLALRAPWQDVAAFLGLADFIDFRDDDGQPWDEMEESFHRAIAEKTRYEWFTDAAEMGWTFAPVEDPFQIMNNPQAAARSFFQSRLVDGKEVLIPKLPFTWEP